MESYEIEGSPPTPAEIAVKERRTVRVVVNHDKMCQILAGRLRLVLPPDSTILGVGQEHGYFPNPAFGVFLSAPEFQPVALHLACPTYCDTGFEVITPEER